MHYRKLVTVGCKLDFFIKRVCRDKNNCNLQSQNTLLKTKARTLKKSDAIWMKTITWNIPYSTRASRFFSLD